MSSGKIGTVVIGLDGAHFELLNPWMKEGRLPNIKEIIQTGISGDLKSVIPPVTSPNWKAYSTGKNPGKLGIFWWENIDVRNKSIYYPNERKHVHEEFWEILAKDLKVGVLGVPTTYPPKPVGEFVISGAPDGQNSGYSYPEDLEYELSQKYNYKVIQEYRLAEDLEKAAEELIGLINLRFRVGKDLMETHNLDFLQLTTFYINTLHHYFWDGDFTRRAWENIDSHLGDLIDHEMNVILMSDHGSTQIEYNFHINQWLEDNGYLKRKNSASDLLYSLGFTRERLGKFASRLGIRNILRNRIPDDFAERVPNNRGEVSKSGKGAAIDWDESRVVASGQGPVYTIQETNDNSFKVELINALNSIRTPNGTPIAEGVYPSEDVYSGRYLEEGPDIVIDQGDGIHISGDVGRGEIFTIPQQDDWIGENKRHGIFVASGPDFTSGKVDGLSILDLAPTLLHLYNNTIPSDMDGEVRKDVFREDSEARNRTVQFKIVDSNSTVTGRHVHYPEVSDRLEDLGYL